MHHDVSSQSTRSFPDVALMLNVRVDPSGADEVRYVLYNAKKLIVEPSTHVLRSGRPRPKVRTAHSFHCRGATRGEPRPGSIER